VAIEKHITTLKVAPSLTTITIIIVIIVIVVVVVVVFVIIITNHLIWQFSCFGLSKWNNEPTDLLAKKSPVSAKLLNCAMNLTLSCGVHYSMGQIIKSVCVCVCVCPSASTLTVAFLDRCLPKLVQT